MKRAVFSLSLSLTLVFAAMGQRGLPPSQGIGNFGKINESLYRGAQPDEAGIKNLKALGVKTIINLRLSQEVVKAEEIEARSQGIVYTNIPLAGMGRPTQAEMTNILSLIATLPAPVFVHCQHGCDRTGTVIACYRIQHDRWSGEEALREAEKYGISPLERGMRQYVMDFARSSGKREKK